MIRLLSGARSVTFFVFFAASARTEIVSTDFRFGALRGFGGFAVAEVSVHLLRPPIGARHRS